MRKFNLRFLIGLMVGTVVVVGLSIGLHELQMVRNASAYVREAKRAQSEDRPLVALEHLSRYVKLAPRDIEGLILYGNQLAEVDKSLPAYLAFEQAVDQAPERLDVRRRAAQLAMSVRRFAEARDHLTYLLKQSPKDAELLELYSDCQIALGKFELARQPLEDAIKIRPEGVTAYVRLARLLRDRLNDVSEADKFIEQMVASNPNNFEAYIRHAEWRIQQLGELKASLKVNRVSGEDEKEKLRVQIQEDLDEALELAPGNSDALFLASGIAEEGGKTDVARKHASDGIELHPDDPRFYASLARIEANSGNLTAAVDILRRGVAVQPKVTELRLVANELKFIFVNYLIDAEKYAEAHDVIDQLRKKKYPEALIDYLDARVVVRKSDWVVAIPKLEQVRPGLKQYPDLGKHVDLWLGLAYRETTFRDQQLMSYRRAVALDPDWIPARLGLAEALMSSNQIYEALDEYQKAFQFPTARLAAGLGLAKAYLLINLRRPVAKQSWVEFDAVMTEISKLADASTRVPMLEMEKLIVQEKLEDAIRFVDKALESNPGESDLWVAQISLVQLNRDWERVEQLIRGAEEHFGQNAMLRMVRGRYLVQRYGAEAKSSLEELAKPDAALSDEQRISLATSFASLFLAINDFEDAIKEASVVCQAQPNNLRIRLLLLDIAMRSKQPELMEKTLREISAIAGEGPIWHYGQAVHLNLIGIKKGDTETVDKALRHLDRAKEERRSWEKIPLLAGEIYEQQGDLDKAGNEYLEAIRLGEKSPAVTGRALALLFQQQRFDDADKLLRSLKESQTLFTDGMVRAEIDLSLQLGRTDQAQKSVEQLVKNSRQAEDPVWLGQVFMTLKKYRDAEMYLRKAIQANEKAARPWVSLVQVLILSEQPEKAEEEIAKAKSAIAADEVMLAVGQCYELLGKPDLARTSYQAALEQRTGDLRTNRFWVEFLFRDKKFDEAETSLRKILKEINVNDAEGEAFRQWATQRLAGVLLMRGEREQLSEALLLIEKNLQQNPNSIEDLRLDAQITARGPSRKEAIKKFVKLLAIEPAGAAANEDRFLLANLYSINDERAKARTELQKLIASKKADPEPRYLIAYAQLCLQAKETPEAELYLDVLQKLAPNDLSTWDIKSQILFAKNKYSEVIDFVKKMGASSSHETKQPVTTIGINLWAGRRLEDLARRLSADKSLNDDKRNEESARFTAEAESFYTKIVEEHPAEILSLAEFLGRTAKIDKALDMLEQEGPRSTIPQIGSVAVGIMKNPKVTAEQLARLQALLKNSAQNTPSPMLDLLAADLFAWRGEVQEAIAHYRDVIRKDSGNIAALNNLAYVIAVSGKSQDEALDFVNKALELGGPMNALLDTRGLVYLAQGKPENAMPLKLKLTNQHGCYGSH